MSRIYRRRAAARARRVELARAVGHGASKAGVAGLVLLAALIVFTIVGPTACGPEGPHVEPDPTLPAPTILTVPAK